MRALHGGFMANHWAVSPAHPYRNPIPKMRHRVSLLAATQNRAERAINASLAMSAFRRVFDIPRAKNRRNRQVADIYNKDLAK